MSYSFTVKAANKADAKRLVAEELAKMVGFQPNHARDVVQAQNMADAYIDIVDEDVTKLIEVRVNGYLSWNYNGAVEPVQIYQASGNVAVCLVPIS